MVRKRKAWWIAGAVGATVALFAGVAFYLDYSSPDARIERAVLQVIEDFDFELVGQHTPENDYDGRINVRLEYARVHTDEKTDNQIVVRLRKACSTYKYERVIYPKADLSALSTDEEWHHLFQYNDHGDLVANYSLLWHDETYVDTVDGPRMTLYITKVRQKNLWEKIKLLWPW